MDSETSEELSEGRDHDGAGSQWAGRAVDGVGLNSTRETWNVTQAQECEQRKDPKRTSQ